MEFYLQVLRFHFLSLLVASKVLAAEWLVSYCVMKLHTRRVQLRKSEHACRIGYTLGSKGSGFVLETVLHLKENLSL